MSGFSLRARIGTTGAVLVLVGLAGAAFADARSFDDRVLRNVTVEGHNVGGLTADQLDRQIDSVEETLRATPIRIATPTGGFSAPGADFGLTVDRPRLRASVLAAGREKALSSRLRRYIAAFTTPIVVPVPVSVSLDATTAVLKAGEGSKRRDPVNPKLKVRNGAFTILPGSDGQGIDANLVVDTIEAEIASGRVPVTVAAASELLPSKFTTEELEALSARATALTSRSIPIVANGLSYEITPDDLRSWVTPSIVNRQVRLTLDQDTTLAGLQKILGGEMVRPAKDAQVLIGNAGEVISIPSEAGLRCCGLATYQRIENVFNGIASPPVQVDLEVIEPKLSSAVLDKLKIKERISTFTTQHKAGEDRVKNIHRIADLVRGTVIQPGDTFSVNKLIGPRTAAKGFIEAHVIEDGVFKDSFGGGISQFATTLFNASFFGGLDIPEYKAHSIYISRYPYGREATLSYPKPDLKIRNTTPYGILIWPTYTDSTLTVSLYSTKFATGEVLDQIKTDRGECAEVVTMRKVTRLDGSTKNDKFRAVYLPKEGVNCEGNPTPGATTTTIRPPETTKGPASDTSADTPTTRTDTATTKVDAATTKPATTRIDATATTPASTSPSASTPASSPTSKEPATTKEAATTKAPASAAPTPAPTAAPTSAAVVPVAPPVTGVSP